MSDYRTAEELHPMMEIRRKDGTWVEVIGVELVDEGERVAIIDLADGKFVTCRATQEIRCRFAGEVTPLIKAARSL